MKEHFSPLRTRIAVAAATAGFAVLAAPAAAQHDATHQNHNQGVRTGVGLPGASASLQDGKGRSVGGVTLRETSAGVLLTIEIHNVAPGIHGFHIHAVGRCVPPAFTSAGDHFAPGGSKHGILKASGEEGAAEAHAGDLPNLHVPADGKLAVEILAPRVTLQRGERSLLDEDGSALVLHAKPDDYSTDPSGNSGDRIACGVIEAQKK